MAVAIDATPLDVALDRIGSAITAEPDELLRVGVLLELWRRAFVRALEEGDARVAAIAAGEHEHYRRAFVALMTPM